jgi:hypothetical protein
VSAYVLEEWVAALKEKRFGHEVPSKSLATRLAHLSVNRSSWGRWLGVSFAALLITGVLWTPYRTVATSLEP